MTLRKRLNHDDNTKNASTTQPQRLFTPSPLSTVPEAFKPAMEQFISQLPEDSSFEDRRNSIRFMADIYKQYGSVISDLSNKPELLEKIKTDFVSALQSGDFQAIHTLFSEFLNRQPVKAVKTSEHDTTSFIVSLGKLLGMAALSNFSPALGIAGMLTSLAVPAAASSFQSHEGVPAGGRDLCSGLWYCIQGYLTDSKGNLLSQFNRVNQQANGGKSADAGALWQLNDCMTMDKPAGALDSIFSQNATGNLLTGNLTSDCSASSSQFLGYQTISTATNLTSAQCTAYTNDFNAAAQLCMSQGGASLRDFYIFLISVGIIAAVAGICTAGICIAKHKDDCKPSCC